MKFIIISLLAVSFASNVSFAGNSEFDVSNEKYEIVNEGKWFERKSADRVYSAVIYSKKGLNKFLNKYPIDLNLAATFFKKKILIIGFSDTSSAVTVDAFKAQHQHKDAVSKSSYYYLDLYDMGVIRDSLSLKKGMKGTSYCAISIDNGVLFSHVQIREGVINGLSEQYGRDK